MRVQNISSNRTFGMTATISKTTAAEVDKKLLKDWESDQKSKLVVLKSINGSLKYLTSNIKEVLEGIVQKEVKKASKGLDYPENLEKVMMEKNNGETLHADKLIPNYSDANIILGLEGNPYEVNRNFTVSVELGDKKVDNYFGFGIDHPSLKPEEITEGFIMSLRELIAPFITPKLKQFRLEAKALDKAKTIDEFDNSVKELKKASKEGHF